MPPTNQLINESKFQIFREKTLKFSDHLFIGPCPDGFIRKFYTLGGNYFHLDAIGFYVPTIFEKNLVIVCACGETENKQKWTR